MYSFPVEAGEIQPPNILLEVDQRDADPVGVVSVGAIENGPGNADWTDGWVVSRPALIRTRRRSRKEGCQ